MSGSETDRVLSPVGRSWTCAIVAAPSVDAGGAVVLTGDPDDLGALAAGRAGVIIETL